MKKSIVLILFLSVFLIQEMLEAQTVNVVFTWTNNNVLAVNFDIYEVKAPPDTATTLFFVNAAPIPDCKIGCTYTYKVIPDSKMHYFRMRAFASNDYYSVLSNTASVLLKGGLLAPVNFKAIIQ